MSASDLATVLEDNQRLRIENDQLRHERDAARRERDLAIRLNEIEETGRIRIESAWRSERDEAIRERDEARREACEFELVNMKQAHEYATYRGWDCYKDKTQ